MSFFFFQQLTGDTTWEFEALESIKLKCITEIVTNVEFWVTVGGVTVPEEAVVNEYCLNECSGQGTCVKGISIVWLKNYTPTS
jgi:hypothetical protein